MMELPPLITAKDNPTVKLYRKLARSKKERMLCGKFVLEGMRLVSDAVAGGAAVSHLLFTQDGWNRYGTDLQIDPRTTKLLLVSDALGMQMAETEHPQGIFAICSMPVKSSLKQLLADGNAYLVLYRLQDPGNMGMMLRTADALGIAGVICCDSCDLYSPKVVRATMGSLFRIPVVQGVSVEDVLNICRENKIETCAAVVDPSGEAVGRCCFSGRTAVLIGNEGNGLPSETAKACARQITIPMHGSIESLNAAMAAGIILWELVRGQGA